MDLDDKPRIDAKTFQEPLWKLAEVMAQKVMREGSERIPAFVCQDVHVMIRQAIATYNLLFYLNADERRENDCYWNDKYGVVAAPLVRSLIDCLYNITLILEDPIVNGAAYRKSGLKKRLLDIEEDQRTYAGKTEWDIYTAQQKKSLERLIHASGFKESEIQPRRYGSRWENTSLKASRRMRRYIRGSLRPSHTCSGVSIRPYCTPATTGTSERFRLVAYFVLDSLPHDKRPIIEKSYLAFLTKHIGRAAMLLLCIATEIQLCFGFDGANINQRLESMWAALMGFFEAKELYEEHYAPLMKARGIAT